jgi:chorismate-pyruvate lyase
MSGTHIQTVSTETTERAERTTISIGYIMRTPNIPTMNSLNT